jgi:chromosome segregation ATPase
MRACSGAACFRAAAQAAAVQQAQAAQAAQAAQVAAAQNIQATLHHADGDGAAAVAALSSEVRRLAAENSGLRSESDEKESRLRSLAHDVAVLRSSESEAVSSAAVATAHSHEEHDTVVELRRRLQEAEVELASVKATEKVEAKVSGLRILPDYQRLSTTSSGS